MYCKYCGKEIANDSVFCQFCGKNLLESISVNKEIDEQVEYHDELNLSSEKYEDRTQNIDLEDKTPEVVIKTQEDSPLHVEISKKKENHSSIIANEIVGNLKMIGLAIIMTLSYVVLFSLIRIDCLIGLKNPDDFGKGFYDDKIFSNSLIYPENLQFLGYEHRYAEKHQGFINYYRKEYFKSDFEEHSKYAIIISFILTIVGRYFIKLFRWVNINKT